MANISILQPEQGFWECVGVNIRNSFGDVVREYENGVLMECQHEDFDEVEPKKYVECKHCNATGFYYQEDYDGELGLDLEWRD